MTLIYRRVSTRLGPLRELLDAGVDLVAVLHLHHLGGLVAGDALAVQTEADGVGLDTKSKESIRY